MTLQVRGKIPTKQTPRNPHEKSTTTSPCRRPALSVSRAPPKLCELPEVASSSRHHFNDDCRTLRATGLCPRTMSFFLCFDPAMAGLPWQGAPSRRSCRLAEYPQSVHPHHVELASTPSWAIALSKLPTMRCDGWKRTAMFMALWLSSPLAARSFASFA